MNARLIHAGWFDDVDASVPAFDPGIDVECPACLARLGDAPRVTISLMPDANRTRAYFFRAHKACWSALSEDIKQYLESSVIDSAMTTQ